MYSPAQKISVKELDLEAALAERQVCYIDSFFIIYTEFCSQAFSHRVQFMDYIR